MSLARWCDYGNHAFKDGAQGAISFSQTRQTPNQWGGQQPTTVTDVMELCPECAATLGLADEYQAPASPAERHAALAKAAKVK